MVQDLVHNLCESLVTNIGDIADTGKRTHPTPITYLLTDSENNLLVESENYQLTVQN